MRVAPPPPRNPAHPPLARLLQVVSVMIPPSKLPEFTKAYFDMFVRFDNGAGRVFLDRRDTQVTFGDHDLAATFCNHR